MKIAEATKEEECCCSCKHNIRKTRSDGWVNCYCDVDKHYIGYMANFENVCERWDSDENSN